MGCWGDFRGENSENSGSLVILERAHTHTPVNTPSLRLRFKCLTQAMGGNTWRASQRSSAGPCPFSLSAPAATPTNSRYIGSHTNQGSRENILLTLEDRLLGANISISSSSFRFVSFLPPTLPPSSLLPRPFPPPSAAADTAGCEAPASPWLLPLQAGEEKGWVKEEAVDG